jgi:hypothetical protein
VEKSLYGKEISRVARNIPEWLPFFKIGKYFTIKKVLLKLPLSSKDDRPSFRNLQIYFEQNLKTLSLFP